MYYIGIDLGGTNIKGALVSETGEIAREVSRPTRVELGAEAVCDGIAAVITELSSGVDRTSLGGVGLGCPGTVDDETGRVLYANNLGWKNFDLRAAVKSRTDFDLRIGNDANVAALAEALVGCAKGAQSAVIVTLGTGVGGGIVFNGKVWNGFHGVGSEIGHMILELDGEPCTCGNYGCVERYCSATAIIRMARELCAVHPESEIVKVCEGDLSRMNAKVVFDAAKNGDEIALKVFHRYVKYLGQLVASLVNCIDPEVIVLGGGVSKTGSYLTEAVARHYKEKCFYACKPTRFVLATLGNDAGSYGAFRLVQTCE